MQLQSPFAALTPTVDADVLQVLAQGKRFFTLPAIVRLIPNRSRSGIARVLDRLVGQGVVLLNDLGGVRTYQLNHEHLLAECIDSIGWVRERFLQRLRDACVVMPVSYAALFGSAARGDMRAESDIDLFFAVEPDDRPEAEDRIFDLVADAHRWTGNAVNPVIYDVGSIRVDDPLIRSIDAEGLPLTEDRRWLAAHLRGAAG